MTGLAGGGGEAGRRDREGSVANRMPATLAGEILFVSNNRPDRGTQCGAGAGELRPAPYDGGRHVRVVTTSAAGQSPFSTQSGRKFRVSAIPSLLADAACLTVAVRGVSRTGAMSFIIVADDGPLRARLKKLVPSWIAPARASIQSLGAVLRRPFPAEPASADRQGLLERGAALADAGAWEFDLGTNELTWTDPVFDIFGLPRVTTIRREDAVALYSEESRAEMERLRAEAIARFEGFKMDAKIYRPDGTQRWVRLTVGVVARGGRPTHLYGLKQDVTKEREKLEHLLKSAEHDALTGLASRNVFQSRFLNASAAARAAFPVGTLVLFDIDGFKQINDNNGHAAGDECLKTVAGRLAGCFPDAQMIARIGGDELALLLHEPVGARLSQRVAACLSCLSDPVPWKGRRIRISASAGVAASDDPWRYNPDAMFSAADAALYEAKRAGRNRMRLAAA